VFSFEKRNGRELVSNIWLNYENFSGEKSSENTFTMLNARFYVGLRVFFENLHFR
jgi:hypothetical protein